MEIKVEDGHVVVTRPNDLKKMKALHGLTRSLIHNMVVGVSEGYTKELEVNGVAKVREYARTTELNTAVEQAVNDCIQNGILAEFLRKHKSEVIAIKPPSSSEQSSETEDETTDETDAQIKMEKQYLTVMQA